MSKEPEDLVTFLRPVVRVACLAAAAFTLIFFMSVVVTGVFAPVPRFVPEVGDAFLYSRPGPGGPLTIVAALLIVLGLFHLVMHGLTGRNLERNYLFLSKLSLFASAGVALLATPFLLRDASSYAAFGETQAVFRSYRDEGPERIEWSSLHHAEFECTRWGTRRGWRRAGRARFFFHFVGGRSVDAMRMMSFGMSQQDSLARLEDLRIRQSAPIIWSRKAQQESFRDQDRYLHRCVDRFLDRFPDEKREALQAALNASPTLRDETLATYR